MTTAHLHTHAANVRVVLADPTRVYASVIPHAIIKHPPLIFDFSLGSTALADLELHNTEAATAVLQQELAEAHAVFGIGKYAEDRSVYRSSALFTGEGEPRSIHLGIDCWVRAGTPVFTPLPGRVHSVQDNDHFLDYGPTIILEHGIDGVQFFTLYGHLSRSSLKHLAVGQPIAQGEQIAQVGQNNENGQWPPHLHFQIVTDMLGNSGDYPGVAAPSQKDYWLTLCPDPNLILRIPALTGARGRDRTSDPVDVNDVLYH